MCGISGLYHPGQRAESSASLLRSLTQSIKHRGPDEDGFYEGNEVSLGMRRLRVMDPVGGSQPISNEDSSIHIILNGEIYRFEALRKDLEVRGHRFKTKSDTEVVVHLYEEYGLDFFHHFDGMFAFALWDSRKQRLLIGRDRFGIKPLFYTRPSADHGFAFCSELQPLLAVPGLSKQLDYVALDHFFTLSYIPHPRSVYAGIAKLSPGSYLICEKGQVEERRYWHLPTSVQPLSVHEAPAVLDKAIEDAVRAIMRSDVPVGAFLSGGMDSSTVVYHMSQCSSHPVETFSVRFKESAFDEGDIAQEISRHLGTRHHELWATPQDVASLPRMTAHFGEPFADPSQIPTYLVSQLARETVTVALSGDGGDEILGGYETYPASMLAGWTQHLPEAFRKILLAAACRLPVSLDHVTWDYKIRKFLMGCQLPAVEHHAAWRTIFNDALKGSLYTPFFKKVLGQSLNEPVFKQWASLFSGNALDRLTQYQFLDIRTYLIDNNLTKVDRMSMSHSLEVRIPLLDRGVFEAALRVPPSLRVRGLRTKVVLRELMKGRLPQSVLSMKKRGFAVPLAHWFNGVLHESVVKWLSPERVGRSGFLRPEAIPALLEGHRRGRVNYSRQIWNILCFLEWYEQHEVQSRQ